MSGAGMIGFGFGPIQAGLFCQAFRRHHPDEPITLVDIQPELVQKVAKEKVFFSNVADGTARQVVPCTNVNALNPNETADRQTLVEALTKARLICTALPNTLCYGGRDSSPAALTAQAVARRTEPLPVILGENHHDATGEFKAAFAAYCDTPDGIICVDTVIGKMSGIRLAGGDLTPIVPGMDKAFLVEAGDHCFCQSGTDFYPEWQIGDDLAPFNALKLYGHNAAHFTLALLAGERGAQSMAEADPELVGKLHTLMRDSIGPALRARYPIDHPLFTADGFSAYTDDLIDRMIAPSLDDAIDRILRDIPRKLAWNDRLIGAIRLLLENDKPADLFFRALRIALPKDSPEVALSNHWKNDVPADDPMAQNILARVAKTQRGGGSRF